MSEDQVDAKADRILKYWCGEDYLQQDGTTLAPGSMEKWYLGGPTVDEEIREKFAPDVEAAAAGAYSSWTKSFNGLAALIIMDQFTRNIYRTKPETYSLDPSALKLTREMMASGEDKKLIPVQRHWIYTPFQHSESVPDQKDSVRLHEELLEESRKIGGDGPATNFLEQALEYSRGHCGTVEEHGRFPHRDVILGRSAPS